MEVEDASGIAVPEAPLASGPLESEKRSVDWLVVARQWAPRVIPPIVYLGAAFHFNQRFWADPQHKVFATNDAIYFSWYFAWFEHSIAHLANPFISHAMAIPAGVNTMWNPADMLLAFVFAPLTATIGATATVGVLESLSPALSAITAYFVLRRLTGRSLGAALGASLYGFGPFFVMHTGHLHMIFAVFLPLAVLVGHEIFVRQDKSAIRGGMVFGALVGVQMLLAEELVVLTAIGFVCALIAAVIVCPVQVRAKFKHAAVAVGVAAGTALLITAVPLYYQFFGPGAIPNGFPGTPRARADLASLVRPNILQYYKSHADVIANRGFGVAEDTAYLGWPLIVLALGFAAWLIIRRERFGIWWLLTTLFVVVLSLGSPIQVSGRRIGPGPWALFRKLPLVGGALPVRLSLITLILVAGLIALALARYRGWRLAVAAFVVALALVPLRPYGQYTVRTLPKTPAFFTSSAVRTIPAGANVLTLPYASYPMVQPMLWQIRADLRFNIVGGYGLFNRNGFARYWPAVPESARILASFAKPRRDLTEDEYNAALASLQATHIRYIVITHAIAREQQVAEAAANLTGCTVRSVEDVLICEVASGTTP
jgi:hypothetical protein